MKIYSLLVIIAGMCLSLVCACGGGGNDVLSALGESCTKTADCVSPLRCVALVCVADADGDADAADNIETMDGDQDDDITEDADLTEPDPDADAAEDDAETAEEPDMADGDEADPEETVEQDAETEIESEPSEEPVLCPGDAPRNSLQDGVCLGSVQVCTAEGWTDDYSAVDHYEETEVSCDGLDNDCNGQTDDELEGPLNTLQYGVCRGTHQTCDGANGWVDDYSDIEIYEETETRCDAIDNDCDDIVDEDCPCQYGLSRDCGTDEGECVHGIQYCTGEGWGPCQDGVTEQPEICDGLDNDCNGQTDDELERPLNSKQYGLCGGSHQTCTGANGWVDDYSEVYGYEETETRCDGIDSDCDGIVDNDWPELYNVCTGTGLCAEQSGIWECTNDGMGAICSTDPGGTQDASAPEICDGFDNDCDGAVDEDLSRRCGTDVGECVHGAQYCTSGSWGPCEDEVTAQPEICDGFDNDCDGAVDEDCE